MKTNINSAITRISFAILLLWGGVSTTRAAGAYDYEIVASAGQNGLGGINPEVSINDLGRVAFVGQDTASSGSFEGVWVGDGGGVAPYNISPGFSANGRDFQFPQINNNGLVVARERVSGAPVNYLVRTWPGPTRIAFVFSGNPVTLPSLSDDGYVSYVEVNTVSGPVATLLKLYDGTDAATIATYSGNVTLRPMVAKGGKIVVRARPGGADAILLYDRTSAVTAVAPSAQFSVLGLSPGISDDAEVATFTGNRGNGPGVFASVNSGGGARTIVRIAGENAGLGGPYAELGRDALSNALYFASIDMDTRIGVTHIPGEPAGIAGDTVLVCFGATPNAASGPGAQGGLTFSDQRGLWVVRLDFDTNAAPTLTGILPVVQAGSRVADSTLNDFAIYDPIAVIPVGPSAICKNSRWAHRVAFWATTPQGQSVFKATYAETTATLHRLGREALIFSEGDQADQPLEVKADRDLLRSQPRIREGLVADGITPLLLMISTKRPPETPTPHTISFSIDSSSGSLATPIEDHLFVLGESGFVRTNVVFLSASSPTGFAYLKGFAADDVHLNAGKKYLQMVLTTESGTNAECLQEIRLAKPPILLIHGYNTDDSTWSPGFLEVLRQARPDDFVIRLNYGSVVVNGAHDNHVNTFGRLQDLAFELDSQLRPFERPDDALHQQWAFTRYQVAAHSQGGVLTRMLCAAPGAGSSEQRFRNDPHLFRGRFERVVTINSPHNGSVIPYYLSRLLVTPRIIVPLILRGKGVLQPKFDPFGEQIVALNSLSIDPSAKFHLLRSTIADGSPPSYFPPTHCVLAYLAMGVCSLGRGPILLPRGSDGVVDFDSMAAGVGTPSTTLSGENIAHAPPLWLFSVGTDKTATRDSGVATRVIDLLDETRDRFGAFVNPANLAADRRLAIDLLVALVSIDDLISLVRLFPFPFSPANGNVPSEYEFRLQPSPSAPIDGPVSWFIEVVGTNGASGEGVSISVDPNDSQHVTAHVAVGVTGTVLLYANYPGTNGRIYFSKPFVVVDHPAGTTLVGLELRPGSISLSTGASFDLELWGVYENGLRSQLFLAPTSAVTVVSSDPTVLTAESNLFVHLLSPGTARVMASYLGLSAQTIVTVTAEARSPSLHPMFSGTNGDCHLVLTGSAGRRHVIETSPDLRHWLPLTTNVLGNDGALNFPDLCPTNYSQRFYRAFLLP